MSDTALAQLNDLIASRMGLSFPKERWPDLLLNEYRRDELIEEAGITAGRLTEIIRSNISAERLRETDTD